MKTRRELLLVSTAAIFIVLQLGSAQNEVTETIGFGQVTDSAREGDAEGNSLTIRLSPLSRDENITGWIVPLTISQYRNYTFVTQRIVSDEVESAINATNDPAEHDMNKTDFNNNNISVTIMNGTLSFSYDLSNIIIDDDLNEDQEQFILVLELDEDIVLDAEDIVFDAGDGILVYTILDNDAIFLIFNISSFPLFFYESHGNISDLVTVQKENNSPETEVVIPFQVLTQSDSAIAGEDFVLNETNYEIPINQSMIVIAPILIKDDNVPETNETLTLSLENGIGSDTLNIFPTDTVETITIIDDDEAQIGFTEELYTVTEGDDHYIEVCITLTDDVSLNSSSGNATFTISTAKDFSNDTTAAKVNEDYDPTPTDTMLILERGQEIACYNITIHDDAHVETNETFLVRIIEINSTFAAGINLTRDTTVVQIEDDDRAVVGFNITEYTVNEGESIEICVFILFPNATVLNNSIVDGEFYIQGSSGDDVNVHVTSFILDSATHEFCFNALTTNDSLVEGNELVTLTILQNMTYLSSGIREVNPGVSTITVIDDDFAVIGLENATYTIMEGSSGIEICVHLIDGMIAPGVFVNYSLDYNQPADLVIYSIDPTMGELASEGSDSIVCHNLTVEDNMFVERDLVFTVLISQSTVWPSNTIISITEAEVTILDDDEMIITMTVSPLIVDEDSFAKISLTYTGLLRPGITVIISIETERGTADEMDYMLNVVSISFTNTTTVSEVTVDAIDDMTLEDYEENFRVLITETDDDINVVFENDMQEIIIRDIQIIKFSFDQDRRFTINEYEFGSRPYPVRIEDFDTNPVRIERGSITIAYQIITPPTNATEGMDDDFTTNPHKILTYSAMTPGTNNTLDNDQGVIQIVFYDDDLVEGNEVIKISLSQPEVFGLDIPEEELGKRVRLGMHPTATWTITDDDQFIVGFNITSISGMEGDMIEVCIRSYEGVLGPDIVLDYLISAPREEDALPDQIDTAIFANSSALNGDYISIRERVSLRRNDTMKCTNIELVDDTIVEIDEVFYVQVEQVRSSEDLVFPLNPEFMSITIIDDDEIMMGFEMVEYSFNESAGIITDKVYIVRENEVTVSTTFTVTVLLLKPQSTASDGFDFRVDDEFNVTITFGGNDERRPFPLEILSDDIAEGNETIVLLITTPGDLDGVRPGAINITTITIVEDDFIQYRYNQSEYSFNEIDSTTEICVMIESGVFVEGGYLTLNFSTSPLTAIEDTDYNTTFLPPNITLTNDTRIQCTRLTIMSDELVEGEESFQVSFDAVDFKGSYDFIGDDTITVTILDNNVAEVGFEQALYRVMEGGNGTEVNVSVCVTVFESDEFQLTDAVSLDYSLSSQPDTAAESSDYYPTIEPMTGTLSLSNNKTCHSMTIRDDDNVEPPEIFYVSINATGPNVKLFNITEPETVVQIVDDDSLRIEFESMEYTFREQDGMVQVCLNFSGPLKNDSYVELEITLIPNGADDSDYKLVLPSPNILRLNISKTSDCVSINITDDNIVEGTEMFMVQFNETDDNMIMIGGIDTVYVFIMDNEVVELKFGSDNYTFSEETAKDDSLITIVIANYEKLVINNAIQVLIIPHGTFGANNATNDQDYKIITNPAVIPVGKNSTSVQLEIVNDTIIEGLEVVTLMMLGEELVGIDGDVSSNDERTAVYIQDNDVATIGFSKANYISPEVIVTVCVSLAEDNELGDGVVINYDINTTALNTGSDIIHLFEGGEITQTKRESCHNITIIDDDLVEAREEFQVSLLSVYNVPNVTFMPDTTTVYIDDEDTVLVGFNMTHYSTGEEVGGSLTVSIVREDSLTAVHDFNVKLIVGIGTNATHGANEDFSIIGGQQQMILFGQTETSHDLIISIGNDQLGEGDEIIILELVTSDDVSNIINVGSVQNIAQITIIEDDMIHVAFDAMRYTVSEGDVITDICVEIQESESDPVQLPPNATVNVLMTANSTIVTNMTDYIYTPATMIGTLNEMINITCFTIITQEDDIVEGTEEILIQFSFMNKFGSFIAINDDDTAFVDIIDDDFFQIGFESDYYEIGEEIDGVIDEVFIVKMDENTLQMSYDFTIDVITQSPYPAMLGVDFFMNNTIPLSVTFQSDSTTIPVPFSIKNDFIEEGYENFTLRLSYNQPDEDGTVQIVTESAIVSIKDDDVVVIGFEADAYIVFEGQKTEVCVAVLDRNLTHPNETQRKFTLITSQATNNAATGNGDYDRIQGDDSPGTISLDVLRQCFEVITVDDEETEEPEMFYMVVDERDHLIEFNPDSTVIWIIDDDSLLLPIPDISMLNCTSTENGITLTVVCIPPLDAPVVDTILCSVDGAPLKPCSELKESSQTKRAADLVFTVNLLEYDDEQHILEIVGLTQVTELLRDTLIFFGADGVSETVTIWQDREFVAAIAIAGVAFIILLLLMLAICLLIFYHRKVNQLSKYSLDLRSENEYVGIDRNLSYRDHDPVVELVDYSHQPPNTRAPHRRPTSQQSHTSSCTGRSRSQQSHERPLSESSTVRVMSQEPAETSSTFRARSPTATAASTTFHVPPPPPSALKATDATVVPRLETDQRQHDTLEEKHSLDDVADTNTEEQLLLAAGGSGSGNESRGLKISRRHSVETGKESRKQQVRDDAARPESFSSQHKVTGGKKAGAYSITYGKELQGKDWEAALQKEFEEDIAREKDNVRSRERRREMEQRERRREREQASREHRAQERRERERQREEAKERRLVQDRDSVGSQQKSGDLEIIESPESFL